VRPEGRRPVEGRPDDQNETSTAVTNPIEALAKVAHGVAPEALVLVDAISGWAPSRSRRTPGAWTLSSAARRRPGWSPRLSFVAVSPRAWEAAATRRCPSSTSICSPTRPAPRRDRRRGPGRGVMFQLDVALQLMEQETLAEIWKRHAASALRFAPAWRPSDSSSWPTQVRVGHGHRRLDSRRPRLESLQRQAPQVRPHRCRRPGRPQGQDLPNRAPRPRHDPEHPERDGGPRGDAHRAR